MTPLTSDTKRLRLKFKVLKPHREMCRALALVHFRDRSMRWPTPWAYLKEAQYRDSIGRLQRKNIGRGRRWWLVGCNCADCDAEIAVEESSILECLPHE